MTFAAPESSTIKRPEALSEIRRPCLFLFPHQDDEFFVLPLLKQVASEAFCIFLTDGSYYGDSTLRRNKESQRVLFHLGLKAGQITFLNASHPLPDTRLHHHFAQAWNFLREAIGVFGRQFGTVFAPAYEGGHPDHDATALLGWLLSQELGCQFFEFPAYRYWEKNPLKFTALGLFIKPPARELKCPFAVFQWQDLLLLHHYRSQWRTWLAFFPFFLYHSLNNLPLSFLQSDSIRFTTRPHSGTLYYEYRKWCLFENFQEKTLNFLKAESRLL